MTLRTVRQFGRIGFDDPRQSRWRGIAAPFTRLPSGAFESKGTRDVIWSSIMNIILTPLGTRIMLPEFGSRVPELVFDPNDQLLQSLARSYVFDAIRRWEPRVNLIDTDAFRDQFHDHRLHVRMVYEIKAETIVEDRTLAVSRGVDLRVER